MKCKRLTLLFLLLAVLAVPAALAEDAADPTSTPDPTPTPYVDSVVAGGFQTPEPSVSPTPAPTPEPPPLRADPMIVNLVEIAHRIDKLAENERFMDYNNYVYASQEQIDAISKGDHTRPAQVFHVGGNELIAALYAGAPPEAMLDFTRPELLRDLVGEIPDLLWGQRETTELALLSTLARYKVFALPGAEGCGMFFCLYADATPILVTWNAENDAVDMAAFFVPDETLAAVTNAEEMSAWFAGMGMPTVPFEEVPLT